MKYEVLKRSNLKRNIIIGMVVVLIFSAVILTFTRAKYRVTESVPLVSGTINFSPYDFNVVAMYLNKGDETVSTKKAPHVGYTLNTEQSSCVVDDEEVENGNILFENGNLTFQNMNYSGTKCSVYFDLIPDSEKPVINRVVARSLDKTSITVTVDAIDNLGIYNYYYQLDNGEEIQSEESTYSFDKLTSGQSYVLTVRVEDAAGNFASEIKNVVAGYSADRFILANEGGAELIEAKGTPNFGSAATTDEGMYSAEDDYGTSYYYRGSVNDNWLKFAGFYWRIIRINGNGTIRAIYNGNTTDQVSDATAINNSTYVDFSNSRGSSSNLEYRYSNIKGVIDSWYKSTLSNYGDYLDKNTGFCGDMTIYSESSSSIRYGGYGRLVDSKNPSLQCVNNNDLYTVSGSVIGNQILSYPIGLITADEVAMGGSGNNIYNSNYYLYNGDQYWTISPGRYSKVVSSYIASAFLVNGSYLSMDYVWLNGDGGASVRPVINLRSDVQLTGSGTTSDPFVVVTS